MVDLSSASVLAEVDNVCIRVVVDPVLPWHSVVLLVHDRDEGIESGHDVQLHTFVSALFADSENGRGLARWTADCYIPVLPSPCCRLFNLNKATLICARPPDPETNLDRQLREEVKGRMAGHIVSWSRADSSRVGNEKE